MTGASATRSTGCRRRSVPARRSPSASTSRSRTRGSSTTTPTPRSSKTARSSTAASFRRFGYLDFRELRDPSQRRRQGLPPVLRMAKIDDMAARQSNDLARDADWLQFEATVSTDADQIAHRAGLPAEGVDRGRTPVFPLRDGQPHPEVLCVPVGALRGASRFMAAASRSRSSIIRRTPTTSIAWWTRSRRRSST